MDIKNEPLFQGYCETLRNMFDKMNDKVFEKEVKTNPHLSSILE